MKNYLKLMRVPHYIKNLLIFSPLAFSGQFFVRGKMSDGIIGFIAFCATSSVIYIINDIKDCEKDAIHPIKNKRPIASGLISVKNACILACMLAMVAITASIILKNTKSALLLSLYFVLNIFYSFGLKNFPIIDILILVSGFTIRVLYGASVTSITVSDWLYLTVISASFFFALGKRRNEIKLLSSHETRKVLKYYTENFLDKMMYVCLGLANTFYALWAMNKGEEESMHYLIWTVPLVILISMAYSMNIERNLDGDPTEVILHDKTLLVLCMIYMVSMAVLLYL